MLKWSILKIRKNSVRKICSMFDRKNYLSFISITIKVVKFLRNKLNKYFDFFLFLNHWSSLEDF